MIKEIWKAISDFLTIYIILINKCIFATIILGFILIISLSGEGKEKATQFLNGETLACVVDRGEDHESITEMSLASGSNLSGNRVYTNESTKTSGLSIQLSDCNVKNKIP